MSSQCQSISPTELADIAKEKSIDLIDVRSPAEFRSVHATMAKNIPLDSLNPEQIIASRNGSSEPLYVICQSSARGAKACDQFHRAGYENVINVEGGTKAWASQGLPVIRGQQTISLERQVRIAAGFLILLGVILSFAVHPGFIWLSAFVGAGLMFAGITDSCAMGMMLAKMPWNRAT